jgi:hypothetical protein
MFEKRKAARVRAQRDEEWRSLVRAVTDPGGAVSESEEQRFLSYLGDDDHTNARLAETRLAKKGANARLGRQ